jgi:alkylated DNA repair dioxygenase AlkB
VLTRIDLSPTAFLLDDPAFLEPVEADALLSRLLQEIAWEQGHVVLFGKSIPEPRLTAWFGPFDYAYSGRRLRAAPFPQSIATLAEQIERASGERFNSVLLNRYRNGRDSVGYHADDEPELGDQPLVASVSLGVTRRFVLRPKRGPGSSRSFDLGHGQLLVMAGSCQRDFVHALPKQPRVDGERVNLTFRRLIQSTR